jgi:hypothetical protein
LTRLQLDEQSTLLKLKSPDETTRRYTAIVWSTAVALMVSGALVRAHNGPPYPVLQNRIAGNYAISLWADPDASDDGSAEGRFWVIVAPARKGVAFPPDTQVKVSLWPTDDQGSVRTEIAKPEEHDASRWFVAFKIDHEGPHGVKASIDGPLGPAEVETVVDAEYDQRPRPMVVTLFVLPFLLIGFVWLKLLLRRRGRT